MNTHCQSEWVTFMEVTIFQEQGKMLCSFMYCKGTFGKLDFQKAGVSGFKFNMK